MTSGVYIRTEDNIKNLKGRKSWNEGLTTKTDIRLIKAGERIKATRIKNHSYFSCRKGKTLEQEYGLERTKEIRKNLSDSHKGNEGYWKDKKRSKKDRKKMSAAKMNKTYEERMGIEKAKECKRKLSKAKSGQNNPMYGKPTPIGSGNCKWYEYNGENLQGTYELRFAKLCDKNNIRWEKMHKVLPYIINNRKRNYLPDFKVWFDKEPVYIETKGYFDEKSQIKMNLVRQQYPDKIFIIADENILKMYEEMTI